MADTLITDEMIEAGLRYELETERTADDADRYYRGLYLAMNAARCRDELVEQAQDMGLYDNPPAARTIDDAPDARPTLGEESRKLTNEKTALLRSVVERRVANKDARDDVVERLSKVLGAPLCDWAREAIADAIAALSSQPSQDGEAMPLDHAVLYGQLFGGPGSVFDMAYRGAKGCNSREMVECFKQTEAALRAALSPKEPR